jgi:hypothetical protein
MKKSNAIFLSELTRFENYDEYEYAVAVFRTMFFKQLFTRCLELKVFETAFLENQCEHQCGHQCEWTHRCPDYLNHIVENKKCPNEFIIECLKVPSLRIMMMNMESFHTHRSICKSKCSYYTEKVKQKLVELGFIILDKYFWRYSNKLKKIMEIICNEEKRS